MTGREDWSDEKLACELDELLSLDAYDRTVRWLSASLTIREAARRLRGDGGSGVAASPRVSPPSMNDHHTGDAGKETR